MEGSSSFSPIAPLVFNGEDYKMWAVRMETYLEALDLWEAVEDDYEVQPLPANPTVAQMKLQKERKTRKSKAKACLYAAVTPMIFTRVMSLKSAKEIWDYLKVEYEGDERIRGMKVLNLIRDFELQRMKESETVKEYSDKLLNIANKVRLLGTEFNDSRIVEKLLVTLPEKFEATITTLENTKDFSSISLAELLNALQAQEQRRSLRQEGVVEGALAAKHQENTKFRKEQTWKNQQQNHEENSFNNQHKGRGSFRKDYPPCKHCGKKGHPPFKCWKRPDAMCRNCKQLGHEAVICSSKKQQDADANVVEPEEEEELFVATCFTSKVSSKCWLVDSGCTNHMTYDREIFKDLRITEIKKVRIGNGQHLSVKGIGDVRITCCGGTKIISNVLYVPEIDQNILSVGQLLEKGCKVLFENNECSIMNAAGRCLLKVKMKGKSFTLNPLEEEHMAYKSRGSLTEIWHKRLEHFHHKGLLEMQSKLLVDGITDNFDVADLNHCQVSKMGKQHVQPFPKQGSRVTKKLQLVHTDICKPQRTTSLQGNVYYIIFIDDLTRVCWIFFLKHKLEAEIVFKKFKAMVENEISCKIQFSRSANVKETWNFGVKFRKRREFKLLKFSDSDWGETKDMRSTFGYSKNQETVAQSTAEAEIIAATGAVNQVFWLRKILVDQRGEVVLKHCSTNEQVADIFTKPLPVVKFEKFREKLGMCSFG